MKIDQERLLNLLYSSTGLHFSIRFETEWRFSLIPTDVVEVNAFKVNVAIGWKRIELLFVAGSLAGELLEEMRNADESGRLIFNSILDDCSNQGASVHIKVNDLNYHTSSAEYWNIRWARFEFGLKCKSLLFDTKTGEIVVEDIYAWIVRFIALVVAILPVEEADGKESEIDQFGFSEGTKQHVWGNRYERDQRNRAAAIAIHGTSCAACGIDFGKFYGPVADGYIHIHHVIPVSKLDATYQLNLKTDLVPLCPNCHAVAHRMDPPLSVSEIKKLLQRM